MTEHHHPFFYSTHKLEAPEEHMEVSALKVVIKQHVEGFNPDYALVLEERGDKPDRPLNDTDKVHIHEFPHFYSQPPANFG